MANKNFGKNTLKRDIALLCATFLITFFISLAASMAVFANSTTYKGGFNNPNLLVYDYEVYDYELYDYDVLTDTP